MELKSLWCEKWPCGLTGSLILEGKTEGGKPRDKPLSGITSNGSSNVQFPL